MAEDGRITPKVDWKTGLFAVPWKYFLASCLCPCIGKNTFFVLPFVDFQVYEQLINDIPDKSKPPEFVDCLETKYLLAGSCCLAVTCCMPICPLGPVCFVYIELVLINAVPKEFWFASWRYVSFKATNVRVLAENFDIRCNDT